MILLTLLLSLSPLRAESVYYPNDYDESRATFREGCRHSQSLGPGFCREFTVPSRMHRDLTIDVAYYGRGGSRLLVLQSGTHGPETYAGAAIQELARRRHLEKLLARGIDVLMIHALNPFGYREGRRADENNVNLNRNFILDGESYQTKNDPYRELRSTFESEKPVGRPALEYARVDAGLLWQLARYRRVRPISEAMNKGQYEFDRGINFGGFGPTPQVAILRELLTPLLNTHEKTVFVDLHTGLGEADVLHLMTAKRSTPAMVEDFRPTFDALAADKIRTTVSSSDAGFFSTTGGVEEFPAALAPAGHEVLSMTAEFGTMGTGIPAQLRSAHRIIVENQAWFNGCDDALSCAQVRQDFLDLFNPTDPKWRTGVLRQADRFLNAVARALR